MHSVTRRRFLLDSMVAAAAAATCPLPAGAEEKRPGSSNNRVRVAVLGCRIRGTQHAQEIGHLPDCGIVCVCDPDKDLAGELAAAFERQQGSAPKAVQDPSARPGRQVSGRGVHRYAQSLACFGGYLGYAGRQGCLCGKAGQPQSQRRPSHGSGGSPDRAGFAKAARRTDPIERWQRPLNTSGRAGWVRSGWLGTSSMAPGAQSAGPATSRFPAGRLQPLGRPGSHEPAYPASIPL